MKNYLPFILTVLGCWGNGNAPDDVIVSPADWDETTRIEYRYGDSSVAPDYHRSYTITITDSAKMIVVDSYGDIVLERYYSNSPSAFQTLKDELSLKDIRKHKEKDSDECSGGTSENLRLYKADSLFFDAYVYHCGGESGTLFLPDGTAAIIREQIPESVDSLINSTINDDIF